VGEPECSDILKVWIPIIIGKQCDAEFGRPDMTATVVWLGRILPRGSDHQTPVPDGCHRVLADAKRHHGVFSSEHLRLLADGIDALFQPGVSEWARLMSGK
jgi:hypothetical protein